jgi:VanZ family protein
MMFATDRRSWLKTAPLVMLGGYWLALFVGTHIPHPPQLFVSFNAFDKVLHFGAYAGLAFLISLSWWLRRAFAWRQWLAVWALTAAFGIFDEVTQIPVGRNCELFDWFADVTGSLSGLALFLAVLALWQHKAGSLSGPSRPVGAAENSHVSSSDRI